MLIYFDKEVFKSILIIMIKFKIMNMFWLDLKIFYDLIYWCFMQYYQDLILFTCIYDIYSVVYFLSSPVLLKTYDKGYPTIENYGGRGAYMNWEKESWKEGSYDLKLLWLACLLNRLDFGSSQLRILTSQLNFIPINSRL